MSTSGEWGNDPDACEACGNPLRDHWREVPCSAKTTSEESMNTTEKRLAEIECDMARDGMDLLEDADELRGYVRELIALCRESENVVGLMSKLLEVAICPQAQDGCNNRGAIQVAEDDWQQCQWCYERTRALAPHTTESKTNAE